MRFSMSTESHKNGAIKMNMAFVTGNQAVAEAVRLAQAQLISVYPITPATGIVDHLTRLVNQNAFSKPVRMLHVESEFSAISSALGGELGGIRSFTATSSQGLMMMAEATYWASGMRIPLVMAVANRSLSAPVTIFSDHQDTVSLRDNGWLQFYVKNVQEAMDTILIAYFVSENKEVLLPSMVCMDGFYLSHLSENIQIPKADIIESFLPEFNPKFPHMDNDDPKFLGTAAWPDYYSEFVYARQKAMEKSIDIIKKANKEFNKVFDRSYGLVDCYPKEISSCELLLIGMGSMMSTFESVVDQLRLEGLPVGLIRIKTFRPFPHNEILKMISNSTVEAIGVLDRALSIGQGGPLYSEITNLLYQHNSNLPCQSFILGIGGRDVTPSIGRKIYNELKNSKHSKKLNWIDINQKIINRWNLDG